jgi:SAM-dependent methyltransferase
MKRSLRKTVTGGVCPACGSARVRRWKSKNLQGPLRPSDLSITDARYGTTLALSRCGDCTFVFADDPDVERLDALYAELDDPSYEAGDESRSLQMRFICDRVIERAPAARTWLDVGAATGLLVREAARRGLAATGVEPSERLGAVGRAQGLDIVQGVLPNPSLEGRTFDVVSLVDVVEHVADPVALCHAAAESLAEGGLMVVVTPDVSSVAARLLGRSWWHFRVAHVGYFSPRSFDRAAARAGLRIVGSERARWYFPVKYLLERTARYLPLKPAIEHLAAFGPTATLMDRVVPLDLFDSSVYFLTKEGADAA